MSAAQQGKVLGSGGGSVLERLLAAPHRAYFAGGVIAVLALAAWWTAFVPAVLIGGRPALMVHALVMLLGVFPLFMFGFIFTAGPRWLASQAAHPHLPVAGGYLAGLLAALAGFGAGGIAPLPGLLLMLVCWGYALYAWLNCIRASRAPDRRHAWAVLATMGVGALALQAGMLWVALGDGRWWSAARALALWGWLLPLFLTVSHRMLPFFTQSALPQIAPWRPDALLYGWLAGCAALVLGEVLGLPWLEAPAAFALAASFAYTSRRWGLRASLSVRLLAMLHLSFAWLVLALGLQGLAALGLPLGSAPAHALALGFSMTMLFGFVTRVSLGHSGRPLQADTGFWALYLGLQGVAALRVLAALFGLAGPWLSAIAGLWLLLLLVWAVRVLPLYLRARADGQPG